MASYDTPAIFAQAVLGRIGAPVTAANMQALTAWMKAEGGNWNNSARYNPLNTTQSAPGSTTMNSVGVRAYTSWDQGLDATVTTLENGHYGGIIGALKQGGNAQAVANAVAASPWGTGNFSASLGSSAIPSGSTSSAGMSPQQQALSGSAYYSPDTQIGSSPMSVEDALSQYGFIGTLANTVPELKNLLVSGAQQGWTTTKFQQKVQDTEWWKTHAEKARENDALKATDPAEYESQRAQIGSHLNLMLDQMGVNMGPKDYQSLVNLAFNQGWADEQLQEFIGTHAKLQHNKNGNLVGQAGNLGVQLKEAYSNYGIKYSGDTINANVRAILAGHSTIDGVTSQIRNAAKSAFPGLSDAIDGGMTVRQAADPYIQSMGSVLEIDPNKLSAYTPEIRKAISGTGDAIDNKVQSSTPIYKFEQDLRKDPRWDKTDNARNAAFQMVHQVGTDWGFSS